MPLGGVEDDDLLVALLGQDLDLSQVLVVSDAHTLLLEPRAHDSHLARRGEDVPVPVGWSHTTESTPELSHNTTRDKRTTHNAHTLAKETLFRTFRG